MDISTNTTLVGGTHSNTPLYFLTAGQAHTLGAGWLKGMFLYGISDADGAATVAAGTATLEVPAGTSASTATALGGVIALECYEDGKLRAVSPVDPTALALTSVTRDPATGRVTGYTLGGVTYAVTYPSATTIVHSGAGRSATFTTDANGLLLNKVPA